MRSAKRLPIRRAFQRRRRSSGSSARHFAAGVAAQLDRSVQPGIERVIVRFEPDQEHGVLAACRAVHHRFARVEQPAIGRVQPRLRELPDGFGATRKIGI